MSLNLTETSTHSEVYSGEGFKWGTCDTALFTVYRYKSHYFHFTALNRICCKKCIFMIYSGKSHNLTYKMMRTMLRVSCSMSSSRDHMLQNVQITWPFVANCSTIVAKCSTIVERASRSHAHLSKSVAKCPVITGKCYNHTICCKTSRSVVKCKNSTIGLQSDLQGHKYYICRSVSDLLSIAKPAERGQLFWPITNPISYQDEWTS